MLDLLYPFKVPQIWSICDATNNIVILVADYHHRLVIPARIHW